MAATNDQAVEVLNRLIQACKDGEKGYRTAAEGVRTPELKQLFDSYASQRACFAGELQAEVERLGGKPQENGSDLGLLHCGWMNIKALVTGHNEAAVIAECESGEDAVFKTYEEAMQADLPQEARSAIGRQ